MPEEPVAYRQIQFQVPPGATELLLVRHGESEAAIEGKPFELVEGHGDPALSLEGRAQAERVGDRKKVIERDPIAVRMMEEQRWDVIPGAEPQQEFARRARTVVERIAAAHSDQRVAVFAHGAIIGEMLSQATGSTAFAFTSDNTGISQLVITAERWILRRYNDTAHLDVGLATSR